MIRVLQLLPRDAEFEAQRGCETLVKSPGEGFHIELRTIGAGGDWRDVPTAAASLRREDPFDIVHAWGGAALTVAALGARSPIVFSPASDTRGRTVGWLRAILAYRRVETIAPTTTLRRRIVQRGVPLERCHLVRPGVDFARIKRRRDPELRARLRFGDSDCVLLVAGESTRAASQHHAAWAAGILHLGWEKYRLLIWGRGDGAASVKTFARNIGHAGMFRVATEFLGQGVSFEELLPAADIVINTSSGAVSTLPLAIAMASGLPIVSTVTSTASELLEDRHTALLAPVSKPRLFARRILDLVEDSRTQWSIADMARTEAYEYFSQTRFLNQYRTVYRQLAAGEKVDVPEPSPGAGLRFHGRV